MQVGSVVFNLWDTITYTYFFAFSDAWSMKHSRGGHHGKIPVSFTLLLPTPIFSLSTNYSQPFCYALSICLLTLSPTLLCPPLVLKPSTLLIYTFSSLSLPAMKTTSGCRNPLPLPLHNNPSPLSDMPHFYSLTNHSANTTSTFQLTHFTRLHSRPLTFVPCPCYICIRQRNYQKTKASVGYMHSPLETWI